MDRKKILLITTGGTISSKISSGKGYSPVNSSNSFAEYIENALPVSVECIQFTNVLSFELTPDDILTLVSLIKTRISDEDIVGAIITQGTATMEETSFLAHLIWDIDKPLVFTGAMLNSSETGYDGYRNLYDSALTVLSADSINKGVLVCMYSEIHSARDVSKTHKSKLSAFESIDKGPLGIINDGRVIYYRNPILTKPFSNIKNLERKVEIVKVSIGSDAGIIEYLVESGYLGIVIECFPGGGGVTPSVFNSILNNISKGVIFVYTPRSVGGTSRSKAAGGCGPFDLMKIGVINGGDLSSIKARILLMLTLGIYEDKKDIIATFNNLFP